MRLAILVALVSLAGCASSPTRQPLPPPPLAQPTTPSAVDEVTARDRNDHHALEDALNRARQKLREFDQYESGPK